MNPNENKYEYIMHFNALNPGKKGFAAIILKKEIIRKG